MSAPAAGTQSMNIPNLAMESSLSFSGRQVAVTVSLEGITIGIVY